MRREFVDITLLFLALGFLASCKVPSDAVMPDARRDANCIKAEYGLKESFCYVSFAEALSLARAGKKENVEIKAVLSLEFGQCVLHRDEAAAANYYDMESLLVKTDACPRRAAEILAGQKAALVNVRGRVEPATSERVRRGGVITGVSVIEKDLVIGR